MDAKEKEFLTQLLEKIENTEEPQEIMVVFLQLSTYLKNRDNTINFIYSKYLSEGDTKDTKDIKFRNHAVLKAITTFTLW